MKLSNQKQTFTLAAGEKCHIHIFRTGQVGKMYRRRLIRFTKNPIGIENKTFDAEIRDPGTEFQRFDIGFTRKNDAINLFSTRNIPFGQEVWKKLTTVLEGYNFRDDEKLLLYFGDEEGVSDYLTKLILEDPFGRK